MKIENLCINCMKERQEPDGVCEHCGFDEGKYDLPQHHMKPFTILAGKYLIGKAIGEGGFGITYIGMDLELEVRVAIKEYYPQGVAARISGINNCTVCSCTDSTRPFFEEGREKFINEARTIAKFRGLPEIVGIIEFFRENQTAYIVMEYLDGQTLKQYLRANGGKIPTDEILRMMRPLVLSLGKIHSEGLIHRDISPDNIMLMKDKSVKILDFGGARDFASRNGKSMSVLVKHGYAPEEQYRSQGDQGPWTDVYALCATMYRCITGEIPPNALDRLYQDELKPISSFDVTCPKYIEKAITKGLNVRKDGRYQSMDELYEALYKEQKKPEKAPKPGKKDRQKKEKPEDEKDSKQPDKKKKIMAAVAVVVVTAGVAAAASVGMKMKQSGEEKVVAEVTVTPTPTATPTPEATPTPAVPEATPTPVQEITQTASGVNIIKKNATYYVKKDVNVRSDCSAEAKLLTGATVGQELTATGISEDGDWIEIKMNGQTGYVFADLVSTTAPAKYHLLIYGLDMRDGDYSVGEQVKISGDSSLPYPSFWAPQGRGIDLIKDIYSQETTLVMQNHGSYVWYKCEDYEAAEVSGQNLYDESGRFIIKIAGEDYTLPVSVQELESKGWDVDFGDKEEIEDYSGYYVCGGYASMFDEESGESLRFYLTGKINDKKQIDIVGIKTWDELELPGGIINRKSTMQDVQNIYGEKKYRLGWNLYYIPGDISISFLFDDGDTNGDTIDCVSINKLPENYTPPQD